MTRMIPQPTHLLSQALFVVYQLIPSRFYGGLSAPHAQSVRSLASAVFASNFAWLALFGNGWLSIYNIFAPQRGTLCMYLCVCIYVYVSTCMFASIYILSIYIYIEYISL